MKDPIFEKLFRKVDDYFSRNRSWFEQCFVMIEKFDREAEEFFYVEVEKLFLERNEEIDQVLEFFTTKAAKGDLNDTCHHTSIIFEKFRKNQLKVEDFWLVELKDYFHKVKDRTDDFVSYKRRLLQLKVDQLEAKNIFYYSFPLIGFNKLQGSVHILFDAAEDRKSIEMKISAIFRNTIVVFTEFYEQLYIQNSRPSEIPDYKVLAYEAFGNSFLTDLDYPRFYLNQLMDQESKQQPFPSITKTLNPPQSPEDFSQVTNLITKGETKKALDLLEKESLTISKEFHTTILAMQSRFACLNKEQINDVISNEEYRNEINRLNLSILGLIS